MKIIKTKEKVLENIRQNICKSQKGHTYMKVIPGYCVMRPNGRKAISMDLGQTVQLHSADNIIVWEKEEKELGYQLKFTVRFDQENLFLDEEIEILEGNYEKYIYHFTLENAYVTPLLFHQLTGACVSGIKDKMNEHNLPDKLTAKQVIEFVKVEYPEWHEKFIEGLRRIGYDID